MPATISDNKKVEAGQDCPSCGSPLYIRGGYFVCVSCDFKATQG